MIRLEREGAVARLRIARPEKKNALTLAMYSDLASAIGDAEADTAVRVLRIDGEGEVFCAGNDLRDFLERPPEGPDAPVLRFMRALAGAGKPVVAAVRGAAIGVGTTMLLHCDLVYAAEGTRLHMPFVDLGLVPEFGSSYLLPARLGHARAAALLMLGASIDAAAALELGLVNKVVPAGRLEAAADAAAAALAEKPPEALRLTKRLMKQGEAAAFSDAMRRENEAFLERLRSPEARAAFEGFLRRK